MSFVGALIPVALVTASWLATASASNLDKCSQQCDHLSYCDSFENKCKPCEEICREESDLSECRAQCRPYLTNIVHLYSSHKLHPDQLHVLTIMVALTAVMTCVIMILLMFLMFLKMKKRKRLAKKINPNVLFSVDKEKIEMETLSAKDLAKGERQESQEINRSINTMMTQLSNNSSNHSDNLPTGEKSFNTIKTNSIIQYFRSDEKF